MDNPIEIHKTLRDLYLKYINSGMPFFSDCYDKERNELLLSDATICQPPIIEAVPKYREICTIDELCENENIDTNFADFVNSGLFNSSDKSIRKLYKHQLEAVVRGVVKRKDIIVTTGTGSGKTECFLLPLIADLVSESKSWPKIGRPRAMRAMILYPLNALAEDQMIRLRKALNSKEGVSGNNARGWLDSNRQGNRFYFGRYTGRTPVSGKKEEAGDRLREERKKHEREWKSIVEEVEATSITELLYQIPSMDEDSAEMWSRQDMQINPPDILITNYSMLNIMLMRNIESPLFEQTKVWLESDPQNVFHIIVDELHTYRGTSGTEVAYILRILLDRLGLSPNSPQVQYLSSSASMEDNGQTREYIGQFFGLTTAEVESRFELLQNPELDQVNKPDVKLPIELLGQAESSTSELLNSLECESTEELVEKYKLCEWLKYGMLKQGKVTASKIDDIAFRLELPASNGNDIIENIIKIICQTKDGNNYIMPLRAHYFFRNINGLWACSDSECKSLDSQYWAGEREIGKIYKYPNSICSCGKRNLEIVLCESCGEIFLGGYAVIQSNKNIVSIQRPVGDQTSKFVVLKKWPQDKGLIDKNRAGHWIRISYDNISGEYKIDKGEGDYIMYEAEEGLNQLPHQCPCCEAESKGRGKDRIPPLKRHYTGVQKVNQVMADALIKTLKKQGETPKIVLFSDSRQSAAKLSAGIELDHYRDALRWAIINTITVNKVDVDLIKRLYDQPDSELSVSDLARKKEYRKNEKFTKLIQLIRDKHDDYLDEKEEKELDTLMSNLSFCDLADSLELVIQKLVNAGISPVGPKPSIVNNGKMWHELFDNGSVTFSRSKNVDNY